MTAIVPELSLDQILDFAAAERFECLEVMCWPVGKADRKFAGVTHLDVAALTQAKAEDIRGRCDECRVGISALGYYPNLLDPDPAIAESSAAHLKRVIAAAPLLGVDLVNTFVGRDWTRSVDDNWPRFLDLWKPMIRFAEDHGVRVGIENCPMLFTRDEWPGGKNLAKSPALWRRMFNDISSEKFGLNFDPSHFALQFMEPTAPLREFKSKLFHVHAKDVKIDRQRLNEVGVFAPPLEWHQPRIPGYGEIDWARFMGALTETGYAGPVCIEVEDPSFGGALEARQRALRVAGNILRPFFGT